MSETDHGETGGNAGDLRRYYRWHAGIYDLTRWAFLFGRDRLVETLAARTDPPARILEIGCGTGRNLAALAKAFPDASLVGLDLSSDMLDRARAKLARHSDRVEFLHRPYDGPLSREDGEKFDLVVFSYSLSMINPGYDQVLVLCREDLRPGGTVAVVDFHGTRWDWFRRWMGVNHVRMEGQILDQLRTRFEEQVCRLERAYGGLWRYLVYVGE